MSLESGLLVFKLIRGELARSNVYLEVLMDDMAFPSYASSKARSKSTEFGESMCVFLALKLCKTDCAV